MTPATLVTAYYENAGMLSLQLATIRALPQELKRLLAVIIVDDGSPTAPAKGEDIGCPLLIYRMADDIPWNQDSCRNIGVHHAVTPWVLLTDMDHVVPEATWRPLLLRKHDEQTVYRFSRVSAPEMERYKPHPNSWFMTKAIFEKVGGYDENFAGLYGTDALFRDQLMAVATVEMRKDVIVRYPREVIADASTTTLARKTPENSEGLARIHARRRTDPDYVRKHLSFEYSRVY